MLTFHLATAPSASSFSLFSTTMISLLVTSIRVPSSLILSFQGTTFYLPLSSSILPNASSPPLLSFSTLITWDFPITPSELFPLQVVSTLPNAAFWFALLHQLWSLVSALPPLPLFSATSHAPTSSVFPAPLNASYPTLSFLLLISSFPLLTLFALALASTSLPPPFLFFPAPF
jgi:hypothetical protein